MLRVLLPRSPQIMRRFMLSIFKNGVFPSSAESSPPPVKYQGFIPGYWSNRISPLPVISFVPIIFGSRLVRSSFISPLSPNTCSPTPITIPPFVHAVYYLHRTHVSDCSPSRHVLPLFLCAGVRCSRRSQRDYRLRAYPPSRHLPAACDWQ